MTSALTRRTFRPVVCIGYGAEGVHWLRRVTVGAKRIPGLVELVKQGILQFWAVGESSHSEAGWWNLKAGEDPDSLLSHLNSSRQNELRFVVPGLELQQIIVVERLSLYGENAEQRSELRASFEAARMHGEGDATLDDAGSAFSYEWYALVDGAWPDGRPAADQQRRASQLTGELKSRRIFYVDHQSSAGGIVPPEEADEVLAQLALALLASDLAFPRPGAGSAGQSQTMSRLAESGYVTPIGVLTLGHRKELFARQRARALLRQLLRGPSDDVPDLLEISFGSTSTLTNALASELRDLENGVAGIKARGRRTAAIQAAVARCLADRSATDGLIAVNRLRSAIESHRQWGAVGQSVAAPLGLGVLAMPEVTVTVAAFGVAALLTVAVLLYHRHTKKQISGELTELPRDEETELTRARTLKEWIHIADALDQVFSDFARHLDRWDSGVQIAQQPWVRGDQPYHWELSQATAEADLSRASSWLYERVGECVAERVTRGNVTQELLEDSLMDIAARELSTGVRTVAQELQPQLNAPANQTIVDAVRQMSPLANVVGGEGVQEIVWLASGGASDHNLLIKLERVRDQQYTRVLLSDDDSQTVRVVFGNDIPWRSIGSLRSL